MSGSLHLVPPLVAAVVFAFGNLLQKRAFQEGAGLMPAFALNHVALGLTFLPMLAWGEVPRPGTALWHPVLAGTAFFTGSVLGLLALRGGDVSVVTPLLGTKVILVAALSTLVFRVPLGAGHLAAAGLTTLGVLVMGFSDRRPGRGTGRSTVLALLCSLCFAVCDTLIQQWAGPFGIPTFIPMLFGTLAVLSMVVVLGTGREAIRVPRAALPWLLAASAAAVIQAVLITVSIAVWRDATGVNVVYALRGLWGLALVWCLGHRFGNTERADAGGRRMGWRLAGAGLILMAVLLALNSGGPPDSRPFPSLPENPHGP
ncbi:MAG: EamA family transporter [Verrucomicrobiae bacterium]|nr:EamA family transporter [Verrucomicrobiae bacterium]